MPVGVRLQIVDNLAVDAQIVNNFGGDPYPDIPALFTHFMATRTSTKHRKRKVEAAPAASTWIPAGDIEGEVARVHAALLDAIMDRHLGPGVKLTEAALCSEYNCSRSSVRTALQWLAYDHVVRLIPNRGAFVHEPDPKEVRDVFTMRIALENVLIDMLLALPSLAQRLQPIYDKVEEEQRAFLEGRRVDWIRLSNAFHIELARLPENEVLLQSMRSLCLRTSLIIALHDAPSSSTCSYTDHARILDLLCTDQRAAAKREMKHHLQDVVVRMESQMSAGRRPVH